MRHKITAFTRYQKEYTYSVNICGIALSKYVPVDAHGHFIRNLTYKLRRLPTLKGAPLAVGSTLREVEMGRMNVVFVWQTTVHRLT